MVKRKRAVTAERVEIVGALDSHEAEALQLELRRLARQYGVAIEELTVESSGPERSDD